MVHNAPAVLDLSMKAAWLDSFLIMPSRHLSHHAWCCLCRRHLLALAAALGPSLQAPTHRGSPSGALPIKQHLQRLIKRGIAVNEATQTPPKVQLLLTCWLLVPFGDLRGMPLPTAGLPSHGAVDS